MLIMDANTALEKLLFPYDTALFYKEYFEKKPLVISRDDESYFSGVLNIDNINEYLEKKDTRYPAIRLVKDGQELPQNTYLRDIPFGNQVFDKVIDNDKLFYHFASGCSIVLQAFHRTFVPLSRLVQTLEKHFSFPLQTNIYLTPASAKGFNAHFDNHDVFLLQVYGSKIWKIYDAPVYLPIKPFDKKKWVPTPPIIEVELKAGDTLYLPRGFVHEGLTANNASMHITLGLLTYKWIDILKLVLNEAIDIRQCRETISMNDIGNDEFKVKLSVLLADISARTDFSKLKNDASSRFVKRSMTADNNRLLDVLNLETITGETIITKRKEISFSYYVDDDNCVLSFYDKQISLPNYIEDAMAFIFTNDQFRINDITTKLDANGKIVLVKSLVKEGFLAIHKDE